MELVFTRSFPKSVGFSKIEKTTRDVLISNKFGIITEIDMQATFKAKINVDTPKYQVLGACNPGFALKIVEAIPDAGSLLPCKVVVYEKDDNVIISALNPKYVFAALKNPTLDTIADEIAEKLSAVLDEVSATLSA